MSKKQSIINQNYTKMKKVLFQLLIISVSCLFMNTADSFSQAPTTTWDIDFEGSLPFTPYCWAEAYTFDQANGVLKVVALDHPWDRFVFWARPFDLGVAPHCDFHIKSDVALDNFNITFKDTTNEAQIDIQFTLPADTVNWTYVYLDLTSEINTLNTPVLAEVQWDPNAAATIWIDDFRMGEAAKPDLSPPTIDPPEDILVFKNAGPQQVTLTGITDGEPEIVQGLTISAISTNTGIIPNPSVSAIAGDSATLSFTPVADTVGQAYIKITLKDNGAVQNTTVDSFLVVMLVDGGTGYLQDFNVDVVPPEVSSLPGHSFSMVDSSLRVNVNRSQRWYGFDYKMGAVVDISGNPYLNVKVRTESDFVLQAFLIDYAGNGYAIELIGGQYLYNELITGEYYFDHNRIYEGDGFLDVLFDFSGVDEYILDLSKITGIKLVANGTSLNHEGVYLIDELALGDSA
ncbi:MAG: hypothetical protein AMS26_10025, partial [Bacteroides sp. SM23_62]